MKLPTTAIIITLIIINIVLTIMFINLAQLNEYNEQIIRKQSIQIGELYKERFGL